MKMFNFTIIAFLITCAFGFSATIYVPDDYPTIQTAISAAANGDTVIVRPGIYVENVDFLEKAITVQSEMGPDVTTIDGNSSGSVVTFKSGESFGSVLDGFTLTNGSGTIDPDHPEYLFAGGGIYCKVSSPTIMNNIVTGNLTDCFAGIACIDGASPKIMKNVVIGNTAVGTGVQGGTGGGGIGMGFGRCAPEIVNNVISGNVAVEIGGGIAIAYSCSPTIKNNTITGNKAGFSAGIGIGFSCSGTVEGNVISDNSSTGFAGGIGCGIDNTTTFSNNLIFGNTAGTDGGGVYVYMNSHVTVTNNTIYGNSAGNGGGIGSANGSSVTVVNTILWENSATNNGSEAWVAKGSPSGLPATLTIDYSDVNGGQASVYVESSSTLNWGLAMIDADPVFADEANNDFHLTFDSPCRNTGDNTAVTEPKDFEGDPRSWDGTVDMGADEFHTHLYHIGTVTPGGPIEVKVVGDPGNTPVTLALGSGVQDPPQSTPYGDLYLILPPVKQWYLGSIPSNGVRVIPATVPMSWQPGSQYPFQALVGPLAPGSVLSNLMLLTVE